MHHSYFKIEHFDEIDSTNTRLKQRAVAGAPSGTVLVADAQTAGRGRMGRSFFSPRGSGLYLSVLLRPVAFADAGHLTTLTAVAVARALEAVGVPTEIKWINDLLAGGKKLCGILVEGGTVDGENDHRIVMSAAVAAVICSEPVTILGAQASAKSYPGFFDDYRMLGGKTL